MNAVLQTLFLCEDFNNAVLNKITKRGTMIKSYKTIIKRINDKNKVKTNIKKLRLTNFIETFRKNFRHVSNQQQDAHEAIFYLLGKFHENLKEDFTTKILLHSIQNMRYNKKIKNECARQVQKMYNNDYSSINKFFYGQSCSVIKCSKCNYEINRVEVFKGLELSINTVDNLDDAIKEHMEPEQLEGYKCNKCKEANYCSKKHILLKTPDYLFVQFKRFEFDWNTNKLNKSYKNIKFSHYLHFKKYLLQNNINKNTKKVDVYKLKCIINHIGGVNSGHYFSYNKYQDTWFSCDDDTISVIDEKKIFSKNAYVLLYEKVKVEE